MEFKVGDIVEAFGLRGTVTHTVSLHNHDYPIRVLWDSVATDRFTLDGRLSFHHQEPSLKLIERPKKKVKKTIERWANVYPEGPGCIHEDKRYADMNAGKDRIACVKLTGEYEVESDES